MATSTAAKTAPKTAAPVGSGGSAPAEPKTRKPRKPAVKAEDIAILGEVGKVSVSEVPREARSRGTRTNPFDAHLKVSFEDNDEAQDVYRSVRVKTDQVDGVKALIRSAANFHDIGSKILKEEDQGDGTAIVWFRAQERKVKGPRKPKEDSAGE